MQANECKPGMAQSEAAYVVRVSCEEETKLDYTWAALYMFAQLQLLARPKRIKRIEGTATKTTTKAPKQIPTNSDKFRGHVVRLLHSLIGTATAYFILGPIPPPKRIPNFK